MISYSLLFCQLIDTHQRMVFAEYSEISRRELFGVSRRFPDPRILAGWPDFRELLENQNWMIRSLAEFRGALSGWHIRLADEVEGLAGVRQELIRVAQFDVSGVREQGALVIPALIESCRQDGVFRIIEQNRSRMPQFPRFDVAFSDLSHDLERIRELRDDLAGQLARIRAYLAKDRTPVRSSENRFPAFAAHRNTMASRTTRLLSTLQECERAARFLPAIVDSICSRQTVLFQAVIRPSLDNLDATIEALRAMATEKREKSGELHDTIRRHRLEADRFEAVAACAKQKAKEPDGQCRDCEERRVFVLAKCGHSFCERCLNRLMESRLHVCPYSRCNLPFGVEDILRINWE
jgi:hypothetical protein